MGVLALSKIEISSTYYILSLFQLKILLHNLTYFLGLPFTYQTFFLPHYEIFLDFLFFCAQHSWAFSDLSPRIFLMNPPSFRIHLKYLCQNLPLLLNFDYFFLTLSQPHSEIFMKSALTHSLLSFDHNYQQTDLVQSTDWSN